MKTEGRNRKKRGMLYVLVASLVVLLVLAFFVFDGPAAISALFSGKETEQAGSASSGTEGGDRERPVDSSSADADTQGQAAIENGGADSGQAADEPVTPEPPQPEVKTLTISAVGDVALGKLQIHGTSGSLLSYYDKYGKDYFFKNVNSFFAEDDLTIANLECVLSTSDDRVEKKYNIEGRPEFAEILPAAGIDLVGTGNNHILDYGQQGAEDTWAALKAAGVPYAYEKQTALFQAENGLRVGVVASMCFDMGSGKEAQIRQEIADLWAQGADLVVVMLHWGIEREYTPTGAQTAFAHHLIDDGADLIAGCHPHVLQGMEVYKGKMILYSEGNFCFGGNKNPSDKDTMIYQQTFTFSDDVLQPGLDAKVIPCSLSSRSDTNDYCPTPLSGSEGQRVLQKLNDISAGLGETPVVLDAEGQVGYNSGNIILKEEP